MLIKKIFLLVSFFLLIVILAGCGTAQAGQGVAADDHGAEMDEHHAEGQGHHHAEAPHEFEDMHNPLATNSQTIAAGQAIFETSCATCHGATGNGDGPAAQSLDPQPASLADTDMMQELSDGYLYWRISEGGQMEPFNSAMPAWKDGLSEQQIWQVISFVRTLGNGHMEDASATGDHHDDAAH